jgi:hypothetical protein
MEVGVSYSKVEYIHEGPRRSGLAITALIFGILSCVCLGPLGAIPALICGFMAMGRARRSPERYGGYGMAIAGVITASISFVIFIGLGLLVIPVVMSARQAAHRTLDAAQIRMLTQIAVSTAGENGGRYPADYRDLFMHGAAPSFFISPRSGTTELRQPLDPQDPTFNGQLESHSDYAYIGADLNLHSGHVEFVPKPMVGMKFDASNRARAAAGLPQLVLGGPPPAAPAVVQAPQPPQRPERPVPSVTPPRPPAARTTFNTADEAVGFLTSARLEERRAALAYLQNAPVDEASRQKVAAQLEQLLGETSFRNGALQALKKWGSKENAPAVRALIPAGGSGTIAGGNQDEVFELLVLWKDAESHALIARQLKNPFLRNEAAKSLIAIGSDAEEAVQPYTAETDATTLRLAMGVLAKIGTEKSLPAMHRALYAQRADTAGALEAIKEAGTRLKLKPEEYMNALLNRYTIEAPAGFTPDTTVDTPNTRQWSRQGAGRTVKSGYTVGVKIVPATYRINPMANAQTLETGTLSFKQVTSESTNAQTRQVYEALDGENLIGLTIVLDNFDTTARTSMVNAARKIQVK